MKIVGGLVLLFLISDAPGTLAQTVHVQPRIVTKSDLPAKVAVVEVAPRFVTTVRVPDTVNSVALGDTSRFQAEHSDREPQLVFVKATSAKPAETNLLISMTNGQQVSLLLVSRGETSPEDSHHVDFLLRYEPPGGFFVSPSAFPSELVGETVPLAEAQPISTKVAPGSSRLGVGGKVASPAAERPATQFQPAPNGSLDTLLEQQESAPLPTLYGEHIRGESVSRDRVRAGVSRVIDGGQQVIVLFSVFNPTKHAILLMPPQIQLSGRTASGRLFHHRKWSTAEQLPVSDYRLSKRRVGPGERADGVVLFERPPYKLSNETLLLQVAESGAVDRPALAPIGFGISTPSEGQNGRGK